MDAKLKELLTKLDEILFDIYMDHRNDTDACESAMEAMIMIGEYRGDTPPPEREVFEAMFMVGAARGPR